MLILNQFQDIEEGKFYRAIGGEEEVAGGGRGANGGEWRCEQRFERRREWRYERRCKRRCEWR